MEDGLAEADRELAEIDRARIRDRLLPEELNRMEREVLERRKGLLARKDALGPDAVQRLAATRSVLGAAHSLFDWASTYGKLIPARQPSLFLGFISRYPPPLPDEAAAGMVLWPTEWTLAGKVPPASHAVTQAVLDQAMDRLHAEVIVHSDRLEVRGIVSFEVRPKVSHASQARRRCG